MDIIFKFKSIQSLKTCILFQHTFKMVLCGFKPPSSTPDLPIKVQQLLFK